METHPRKPEAMGTVSMHVMYEAGEIRDYLVIRKAPSALPTDGPAMVHNRNAFSARDKNSSSHAIPLLLIVSLCRKT